MHLTLLKEPLCTRDKKAPCANSVQCLRHRAISTQCSLTLFWCKYSLMIDATSILMIFFNSIEISIFHFWLDSEAGGEIWNGRWTQDLLSSLLANTNLPQVSQQDYIKAFTWLTKLNKLLPQTKLNKLRDSMVFAAQNYTRLKPR